MFALETEPLPATLTLDWSPPVTPLTTHRVPAWRPLASVTPSYTRSPVMVTSFASMS